MIATAVCCCVVDPSAAASLVRPSCGHHSASTTELGVSVVDVESPAAAVAGSAWQDYAVATRLVGLVVDLRAAAALRVVVVGITATANVSFSTRGKGAKAAG